MRDCRAAWYARHDARPIDEEVSLKWIGVAAQGVTTDRPGRGIADALVVARQAFSYYCAFDGTRVLLQQGDSGGEANDAWMKDTESAGQAGIFRSVCKSIHQLQ